MSKRTLLAAGFVPLPWFLLWSTIAGMLSPDYSELAQHASELTFQTGVPRTLLSLAAIGSGVGFIAFALGLWLESGLRISIGAICWILFGASMVSNGLWPMGSPLHGLYAIGVANLAAPALSLLELPRLRDNRLAYGITAFVSVCGVIYLWLNLIGLDPQHFRGLTQRVFSSINAAWPAVMAWLLLRQGRG